MHTGVSSEQKNFSFIGWPTKASLVSFLHYFFLFLAPSKDYKGIYSKNVVALTWTNSAISNC